MMTVPFEFNQHRKKSLTANLTMYLPTVIGLMHTAKHLSPGSTFPHSTKRKKNKGKYEHTKIGAVGGVRKPRAQ